MSQILLKSRKNEVFQGIVEASLDPALFEWREVQSKNDGGLVSRLVLREDPDFYFHFDYLRGMDWAEFCPGEKKRIEEVYDGSWEGQKRLCLRWAQRLRQELETRDLWEDIDKYRDSFSIDTGAEVLDEPISAEEADNIRESIEELKGKLAEAYALPEEQVRFISGRLDLLADAARRQNKLTWVHTAIGVLITIAWSISPEDLTYYWNLVRSVFRPFVHLIAGQ